MTDVDQAPRPRIVYGVTSGGSAETLLRGQLQYMQSIGWDVTLISTPDSAHSRTLAREGVTGWGINMERNPSLASDVRALIQWIFAIHTIRPDVVSIGTPKAALLGILAAWLNRTPKRVYVMRGLRLEGATGLKRIALTMLERLTVWLSTETVVVSRSLGISAHNHGASSRPLLLVGEGSSNGVDTDRFNAAYTQNRDQIRTQLNIPEGRFVVGFVGRISPDKGTRLLAAALNQMPKKTADRTTLVLVGPAENPTSLQELQDAQVETLHVGWVADPESYFEAFDVLVLPTRREGFPNVVLEAACCEIPTIATRATGTVDAIDDNVTGLLIPQNAPGALARALDTLANSPDLARRLGRAARERAASSFQQHRIWEGLDSVYRGQNDPDVYEIWQRQ